jgi:hypothetical protein
MESDGHTHRGDRIHGCACPANRPAPTSRIGMAGHASEGPAVPVGETAGPSTTSSTLVRIVATSLLVMGPRGAPDQERTHSRAGVAHQAFTQREHRTPVDGRHQQEVPPHARQCRARIGFAMGGVRLQSGYSGGSGDSTRTAPAGGISTAALDLRRIHSIPASTTRSDNVGGAVTSPSRSQPHASSSPILIANVNDLSPTRNATIATANVIRLPMIGNKAANTASATKPTMT